MSKEREILLQLWNAALHAVDPIYTLQNYLPKPPKGKTIVIGAGKASARMALALEQHWQGDLSGIVVTRYGHGEDCKKIRVIEAGHPVPDAACTDAAKQILNSVKGLTQDDLVIALVSGGGSSLLSSPAPGLSLDDKRDVTIALLKSGATISDINCVRKHMSSIKGGKLGLACGMASVHTLVLSDVPGDDPRTVASGPTLDEATSSDDALLVLQRYRITPPVRVYAALKLGLNAPTARVVGHRECHVIATAQLALDSAARQARIMGIHPIILGNSIEGEARHIGVMQANIARQIALHSQPSAAPAVILSGGETTVTVQGSGRGGRNTEYLLAHALACKGLSSIWGFAADTDGIDGSESNAGAIFDPDTLYRAKSLNLDGGNLLAQNDAYSFFEALGDLIVTGPTRTNVNDFRATLVL